MAPMKELLCQSLESPGAEKQVICHNCPGKLKGKQFIGLPFIWDTTKSRNKPNEYIDGQVLDPIGGKIYKGKARLNANGKRLTLRGLCRRFRNWTQRNLDKTLI